MTQSTTEICNLLYRYAELMDSGDLEAVAEMFRDAKIKTQQGLVGHEEMLAQWRRMVKIYPCGTPRTKHVITNPIIDLDATETTATCRSYYTVLQASDDFPLQIVAAGRYHDTFQFESGQWRFSFRDYSLFDLKGDLRHHLNVALLG